MESSAKSPTTVKDPVCGMNVEPSTAKHKMDHAGRTYYFCCAPCREKFEARPGQYLAPRPAASSGLQVIDIASAAKPPLAKSIPVTPAVAASANQIPERAGAY